MFLFIQKHLSTLEAADLSRQEVDKPNAVCLMFIQKEYSFSPSPQP